MKNISKLLKDLMDDFRLSKELLAAKLGVSTRTIERWLSKENNPNYATRKLLNQIYNGYKNKK